MFSVRVIFSFIFSDSKTHCSVTYRERSRLAKVGKWETNNWCISLEVWFLVKAISFALPAFFSLKKAFLPGAALRRFSRWTKTRENARRLKRLGGLLSFAADSPSLSLFDWILDDMFTNRREDVASLNFDLERLRVSYVIWTFSLFTSFRTQPMLFDGRTNYTKQTFAVSLSFFSSSFFFFIAQLAWNY